MGEDSLYIEQQKVKFYEDNADKNRKLLKDGSYSLVSYNETIEKIKPHLPSGTKVDGYTYNVFDDPVYVHFAVTGDSLNLDYLCDYSDKIVENKKHVGRPLVIYHYDPRGTAILLTEGYTLTEQKVGPNDIYFVLGFTKNSRSYKVYIFNHGLLGNEVLNIMSPKDSLSKTPSKMETAEETKSSQSDQPSLSSTEIADKVSDRLSK